MRHQVELKVEHLLEAIGKKSQSTVSLPMIKPKTKINKSTKGKVSQKNQVPDKVKGG